MALCWKTHPSDKTAPGKTLRQECASKFKEEQAGLCGVGAGRARERGAGDEGKEVGSRGRPWKPLQAFARASSFTRSEMRSHQKVVSSRVP